MFKKEIDKVKEGEIWAQWNFSQIEWDTIAEKFAKNDRFDWKMQLKFGGGAMLVIAAGALMRSLRRHSDKPTPPLTLKTSLLIAGIVLVSSFLIGLLIRLGNRMMFPRVKKGATPQVILSTRGLCLGTFALAFDHQVAIRTVEFIEAQPNGF